MMRAVLTSTVLQVLSLALGMADRIVISALMLRLWGVGVFEDWSVLIATTSLLGFLDLGLHMTFGSMFTEAYQSGQHDLFRRRVAAALFINGCIMILGVGVVLAVALSGNAEFIAHTPHISDPAAALVLVLTGAVTAIQTFSGAVVTIYRAQGLYSRSQAIDFGTTLARIVLTLICLGIGGTPVVIAAVMLVVQAASTLIVIPQDFSRLDQGLRLRPSLPHRAELREISRIAPQFYIQHATNVALLNLPVVLVPLAVDAPGAVASFLFTRTLVNVMRQIMAALSNALGIELSRLYAADTAASKIAVELTRSSDLITVVSACAYGGLLVTNGSLMAVLSGGKLEGNLALVAILGSALVANAPFAGTLAFLNYSGRIVHLTWSRIITVSISCIGALLFLRFGLLGIGLALALGETVGGAIVYLRIASEQANMSVRSYLSHTARLVIVGLAPVLAAGTTLNALLTLPPAVLLIVQSTVLGMLSVLLIYLFGLRKRYRDRLKHAFRQRFRLGLVS